MEKILKICSPQLGMDPDSVLGGEVHDDKVLSWLSSYGHQIYVYLPKNRPYRKDRPNLKITFAPITHIPALLFNIIALPYIFRIYRQVNFDILRVHSPYFTGIGALIFKLFHRKVPVVATYHLQEEGLPFHLINKLVVSKFDSVIAVSNFVKNWLITTYGINPKKISVIHNGIAKEFVPKSKNPKLIKKYNLAGKITILFMGLLIKRKNPIFLLQVFEKLKKKYPNLALLICGDGPFKSGMISYIETNKISDVIFAGNVSGQNKIDHYNLADIFVLPSKQEGFGLAIVEAMACAKPPVISKAWSASEIIKNGVDGFLARRDDVDDWLKKIEILIRNPNLRVSIGKTASLKVKEKFSWAHSAKEHERLFGNLLKNVS